MTHTVLSRVINRMKEAESNASLKDASFGFPTEMVSSNPHMDPPIKGVPIDEFIKSKVKLHHDTWIRGPLQEAIALLEQQVELVELLIKLQRTLSKGELQADLERIDHLIRAGQRAADRDGGIY